MGLESDMVERADICVQCHSNRVTSRYLHGPIGTGSCLDCHEPHGAANPMMLAEKNEKVCYHCREQEAEDTFIHDPVKKGNCVKCHNPHGSEEKFFMRKETIEICNECHGQFKFPKDKYVHGPVASGDCDVCHDPHSANNPRLLRKEGNTLCFICHTESIIAKKNIHKPLAEGAVAEKAGCTVCHTSHQSKNKFQLKEETAAELCFGCHEEKGEFDKKIMHGLKQELDCSLCHDPHASNNNSLLKFKFPKERKNEYDEEIYELCFQCHLRSLVAERYTWEKTNFRDGSKNLHFVHVKANKRNCNLCHDIHSSNNELFVREFKVYPKDPLSKKYINKFKFLASNSGGSCEQNNCHANHQSYNRLKSD